MSGKQSALRIQGLVSLMNSVRDQLRNGIADEDAGAFRETIKNAVRTVDNICRAHKTVPAALPRPSARAYAYLKNLDLAHLPKPEARPIVTRGSIRVSGVVATCRRYHRRFSTLVLEQPGPYTADQPAIHDLRCGLQTDAEAIAGLCEDAGGSPAALPVQSERGYQWLSYLGDPEHLKEHLRTLALLYGAGQKYGFTDEHLETEMYATSALYRTKATGPSRHVLVNEGFIAAPPDILDSLMALALHARDDVTAQETVRAYNLSSDFAAVQTDLKSETAALPGSARGQHHDLDAAFDRVNRTYLGGKSERPRLIWSRQPSRRKLGHYDQTQDTVLVSMSLDNRRVPDYVIDFVVYHEMLHRQLGTTVVNGRRVAHTPTFRKREKAFKDYDRARAYMDAHNRRMD